MSLIYEPKGKAREYSPLALNYYKGCDHGCQYCYCKTMPYIEHGTTVTVRQNFQSKLTTELAKNQIENQVLLSFISDPYCQANDELKITHFVLQSLLSKNIPVAILTKGGTHALQDLDLFKKYKNIIKVGATLTCDNDYNSRNIEPGAALPANRLEMLSRVHENGIRTWVSIEPVLFPDQSLKLIEKSMPFVDEFMVGKLNHVQNSTDWHQFLIDVVTLLRNKNKSFYIKADLAKYKNGFVLEKHETDMNYLTIKRQPSQYSLI